jgi:hypothetical protein
VLWATGRGSGKRSGVKKPEREYRTGFLDVPPWHAYYSFVNTLALNAVTTGCSFVPSAFCPDAGVTRAQMSIFLLRAKEGAAYLPPACTTPLFNDVPCTSPYARWINELVRRGVTTGCGAGNFCPDDIVTREQMAVFLLLVLQGPGYNPPACATPTFTDVPCTSAYARWIYDLVARGISGGCGGSSYCPTGSVTRGQMSVFLVRTYNLR